MKKITDDAKAVFKSTKQILDIDKKYAIEIEDYISTIVNIEMLEESPSTKDSSVSKQYANLDKIRY